MPTVLRGLPFFDHSTTVEVGEHHYPILTRQHLVWVSISPKGPREPDPRMPRFPAIYDTGFTGAFLIHQSQLQRFAGLLPDHLARSGAIMRPHGRRVPIHAANVWLHPNRRGQRDEFSTAPPFLLDIPDGIGISSAIDGFPRLPLLGPLAFRASGMEVCIDHARYRINARTPRRFWVFG
jgi:hypothetical protein